MRLLSGLLAVALHELVDAAFGIHHGLLARVVRMAGRANVAGHCLHRRTGVDDVAARAGDGGVFVLGMNVLLHDL